eukprot:TRINITY_DN15709_c0_g1::TRINITY_DN15709_c0_g1_i1::g.18809::m.18809 TRINITY_DN15709_c0_g1::TRINITY_DN15709_c0_g1_i1::g.18809  ORF type:complete len:631 (+),score=61.65,sp/Q8W0Z9/CCR4A_ARATH/35.49/1e-103,Exo_endo_phos/PF03372.18/1.5e-23,Exo_endo_phos_2/PF14529.1/0.0031 TRINITY_DN15709_c0_g1_i1:71-1963(+)
MISENNQDRNSQKWRQISSPAKHYQLIGTGQPNGTEEESSTSGNFQSNNAAFVQAPQIIRIDLLHTNTPVEGCELSPYVVVRMPNGDTLSADNFAAADKDNVVRYKWSRRRFKRECSAENCCQGASIQCVTCVKIHKLNQSKRGTPSLDRSYFCSSQCMKNAWAAHSRDFHRGVQQLTMIEPDSRGGFVSSFSKYVKPDDDPLTGVAFDNERIPEDIESNSCEWQEVSKDKEYTPVTEDIGRVLRLDCCCSTRARGGGVIFGPSLSYTTDICLPVPPSPPKRRFIASGTQGQYYSAKQCQGAFKVLSYNTLAELYTNPQIYPYCPSWALAWNYRKRNILREILSYHADIMCLQELQEDHFDNYFKSRLEEIGYEGVFKKKTREAMGKDGKMDGCAIFYRKEKFALREVHEIEYNTAAARVLAAIDPNNQKLLQRLLKDNVAQVLVLEVLAPVRRKHSHRPQYICIANTHMHWDPSQTDVKLFQTCTFLEKLEAHLNGRSMPVVVAGDFNSMPDSMVYELITSGNVSTDHPEMAQDSYGMFRTLNLNHNLHLHSAYGQCGGEPEYTNFTGHFVGVLDYVFFSSDSLQICGTLEILPDEVYKSETALPSSKFSSDHIAIMADFDFVSPPGSS